ncbi:hypothetical protein D3C86_2182220 [compost metagenome]
MHDLIQQCGNMIEIFDDDGVEQLRLFLEMIIERPMAVPQMLANAAHRDGPVSFGNE